MTDAKKMQEAAAKLVEDALKDAGDHPTANAMRRVYADLADAIRALPLSPVAPLDAEVAGDRKDVLIQMLEGQLKEGDGERIKLAACLLEERLNHIETRARAEKAEAEVERLRAAPVTLADATDEEILAELVRRNPPQKSPRTRTPREYDVLVGIGKDNSVNICFWGDDLAALRRIAEARHD